MHSKSDNIKIMIYGKANKATYELFESILFRYQIGLEESMKGNDFIFDCVNFLYYKLYKMNLNCGGSYVDSTNWIKNKKSNNKSYRLW